MKTRLGLVLASSVLVAAGACASSSGGGGGGGTAARGTGIPGAETVATGENPRHNDQTDLADDQLKQAQSALDDGNEQEARTHFQQAADAAGQAITADPRNPLPWRQGATASMGLGDYEAADSMFTEAVRLRPIYEFEIDPIREQRWIELYNEAAPLVNSGDYDSAAVIFADANAIYRKRPEVMLTLGQIYAQQGKDDQAVELLRHGLAVVDSASAEGADSATVAAWQEQTTGIPVLIAQTLMNAGRYEEGAAALRGLLADDPDNLLYKRTLANVYVQMEQPDSAAALYSELLQAGGLTPTEYYQIGVGFYQIEHWDDAAAAFKDAVDMAPRDRDAAEMWARCIQIAHPRSGEEETAPQPVLEELQQAAQKWVDLDPYSQTARIVLAQTENRLGNADQATQLVNETETLTVNMDNLQLRRFPDGGGQVTGSITNNSLDAGASVTVTVTFYGEDGSALGTQSVSVRLPDKDASQVFELPFDSDQQVWGYTYTLEGV